MEKTFTELAEAIIKNNKLLAIQLLNNIAYEYGVSFKYYLNEDTDSSIESDDSYQ